MKIYIAGKISGLSREAVTKKFEAAQKSLVAKGHQVFIPSVLPAYEEVSHEDYLHICYAMIAICDAVYLLSDWQQSKGARLEYEYALANNKQILFQDPEDQKKKKMDEENIITERRNEVHGKNQIILTVYRTAHNRYTYSIQLKVERIIRCVFPHQLDTTYDSSLQAKHAALNTMLSWTDNSRSAKKSLFEFDLMNADQPSLFDELDLPAPASS